jgi:GNAT superfamily N-acetyltransferase
VTAPRVFISRASIAEARPVATLMSHAFHEDPVSRWLMPAPGDRRVRHPQFFRVFVDRALTYGEISLHYSDAYDGAALWFDVDTDEPRGAGDLAGFDEVLGPGTFERFQILDQLMHQHHPIQVRHAYLALVAVTPGRQRQGIGRALLEHKLAQLDQAGVPGYLEATTADSRRLYERLGFLPLGDGFALPNGGPHVSPMWRVAGAAEMLPPGNRVVRPTRG